MYEPVPRESGRPPEDQVRGRSPAGRLSLLGRPRSLDPRESRSPPPRGSGDQVRGRSPLPRDSGDQVRGRSPPRDPPSRGALELPRSFDQGAERPSERRAGGASLRPRSPQVFGRSSVPRERERSSDPPAARPYVRRDGPRSDCRSCRLHSETSQMPGLRHCHIEMNLTPERHHSHSGMNPMSKRHHSRSERNLTPELRHGFRRERPTQTLGTSHRCCPRDGRHGLAPLRRSRRKASSRGLKRLGRHLTRVVHRVRAPLEPPAPPADERPDHCCHRTASVLPRNRSQDAFRCCCDRIPRTLVVRLAAVRPDRHHHCCSRRHPASLIL